MGMMEAKTSMEVEFRTNVLIQPEVMSTKIIVDILRQRGATVRDDDEREKLLDLYDKLVLPKPQRSLSDEKRSHKSLIQRRDEFSKINTKNGISVPDKDRNHPVINRKRPAENSNLGRDPEDVPPGTKKKLISWP